MFGMTSCSGWFIQPSYPPPTPFLPATVTPSILSPTPVVIGVSSPTPDIATPAASNTPVVVFTDTAVATNTLPAVPAPAVSVEVLGCNTSIDVTHGMGEVTNAFVTLKNAGNVDLTNVNVTLNALDEGREHPDKTVELTSLPVGYQVTFKLTVDSTYREETPIQIEVNGDGGLFQRVGADSCRDIGVLAPNPADLRTPVPVNP